MSDERDRWLAMIEPLAVACLREGDGWQWGPCHPEGGFATFDELSAYAANIAAKADLADPKARELWSVFMPEGDESLFVCLTGNGPTSEAHARFIAIAPSAVLQLIRELRREIRARKRLAEQLSLLANDLA